MSDGYLPMQCPTYMLTLLDQGADITPALAVALEAGAWRWDATGEFVGFIAFASLTARRS